MITLVPATRGLQVRLAASLALCGLLLTNAAEANGRFPRAQRLLEDPRDSSHLVLSATYGLLVSSDGGGRWRYVCEAAYGETDLSVDALTALSSQGALLAGIYSGVSRASDGVCGFQRTLGRNNREAVPDFALAPSSPGRVVAIVVSTPADAEPYSQLHGSDDDGLTWQAIGKPLPAVMRTPLTVDVAPSDSNRVYLSGLGLGEAGVLLRSDDGGESFAIFALPTDPAQAEYPYIAAVDPENPDRLYVRTDAWRYDAETGSSHANDALVYSDDGGASFVELMRAAGKLFGFAFSPDGDELLLGYGDPLEPGGIRFTKPDALGMYGARKGTSAFEKRYAGSVSCLTWSERGIYACTHESETGFSLGAIADTTFDLAAPAVLEPLLVLADVVGPVECPACSAAGVCPNYWYSTCQGWGRADCRELQSPVCSGEDGGGAGGDDSAGPGPMAGGEAISSGGASTLAPRPTGGGCACRGSSKAAGDGVWLLALLLAGLVRRRSS